MTSEEKYEELKCYIEHSKKYNEWLEDAKKNLLTNLAPRVYALGEVGYMGCGFHYDMEQRLGKLICKLAFRWEPCMNHFDKCKDDFAGTIITKIIYENLVEDIEKGEKGS
jgi:hypothetical protein